MNCHRGTKNHLRLCGYADPMLPNQHQIPDQLVEERHHPRSAQVEPMSEGRWVGDPYPFDQTRDRAVVEPGPYRLGASRRCGRLLLQVPSIYDAGRCVPFSN